MAKSMSMDGQILMNVMKIQEEMTKIIDSKSAEDIVKDKHSINELSYYIVRLYSLRKQFSGKTKKALDFFSDFKYDLFTKHMVNCYPMVSNADIVDFAITLSDEVARASVDGQYGICIKESEKVEK